MSSETATTETIVDQEALQKLVLARDAEKQAAITVENCKESLKAAKAVWEMAAADLAVAVDGLIEKRQPTLFDSIPTPTEEPPTVTVPTPTPAAEPERRITIEASLALSPEQFHPLEACNDPPDYRLALPAGPTSTEPSELEAEYYIDRTAEWEAILGDSDPSEELRPADCLMLEQIKHFREQQASLDGATPTWGLWSEFDVLLESGDQVHVLYIPDYKRFGTPEHTDHITLWGSIHKDGTYSDFIHNIGGKRPVITPLQEWAREFAQQQFIKFQLTHTKPKRKRQKAG